MVCARALAVVAVLAGGCRTPPEELQLRPTILSACAPPVAPIEVSALSLRAPPVEFRLGDWGAPATLGPLSADTVVLTAIVGSTSTPPWDAVGRTADGALRQAGAGSLVPFVLVPPDRFCAINGALAEGRTEARVAPLDDGSALVVGGVVGAGVLRRTDGMALRYDPATASLVGLGADSTLARIGLSATSLGDRVVIAGGSPVDAGVLGEPVGAIVVFDGRTATFASLPNPLCVARRDHAAVLLPDGRVLVAGGVDATGAALQTIETVDPVLGATSFCPSLERLGTPRARPSAVLLPFGSVLLLGGQAAGQPQAEEYRVASGTRPVGWTAAAPDVDGATTVALPSGGVALVGGGGLPRIYVATASVLPAGARIDTAAARVHPAAVALADGTLLWLGGGAAGAERVGPWLLDGGAPAAQPVAASPPVVDGAGAARLADGTVLVVGGVDAAGVPAAGAWLYAHDVLNAWSDPADAVSLVPDLWSEWRLSSGAVSATATPPFVPRVVLAGPVVSDVVVRVTAETIPGVSATVAVLFGHGSFEPAVALSAPVGEPSAAGAAVSRLTDRVSDLSCTALFGPATSRRLVATRQGDGFSLCDEDRPADCLSCTVRGVRAGEVGLAVLSGSVRFSALSVERRY